jgi:predicted nucleic acid-binding protein
VYYLDSSAWIKRYLHEDGSSFVTRLFRSKEHLACSILGLVEVNATVARRVKRGDLSEDDFSQLSIEIRMDWQLFYQLPVFPQVTSSAVMLAREEALRGMDALHLASAIYLSELQNELDFTLVGSDVELNAVAQRRGLRVIDPSRQADF